VEFSLLNAALAAGAIGFLPKSMFGMDELEETWAGLL